MLTSFLIGLAASAAGPIAADKPGVDFDVQCVFAAQSAAGGADPEIKGALQSMVTYYMGRLDAEATTADLEVRMLAVGKNLEGQNVGPLLQKCGDFLKTRGEAWQAMGGRIDARERASTPQK